ncbi:MAG TPA: hypothetical protein PLM75_08615 [bacterium]|nr:hypothetical protein [bacterium]
MEKEKIHCEQLYIDSTQKDKDGNVNLIVAVDEKELENERKTHGKTILFASDETLDEQEIINIYYSKNKIDELHKILKCPDGVMFHPNWVWTDSKLMVQAFVNILALTILKLIEKKFKESNSKYATNAILLKEILQSIQLILVVEDLNKYHKKVNKFSLPFQQELFDLFNMKRFVT